MLHCVWSSEYLVKSGFGLGLLLIAAILLLVSDVYETALLRSRADYGQSVVFLLWRIALVINVLALIWRIWLIRSYRTSAGPADDRLPTCTVIMPAFNEGPGVLEALRRAAASDYPPEKLSIVAIDDGSRDDTWIWIKAAAAEIGPRLKTLRLSENRGKRRAMYEALLDCESDMLVSIDSDSLVAPSAIRNLVGPMILDPLVGAVSGNVRVLDADQNWLARMLDVSFTFSFDFIRAGQSQVKTVMCTPGALSGYRGEAVRPVLDEWVRQRFCGREANIGEDRALTNLIIRGGYHVRYERSAVVHTKVPETYSGLCRMFLRWARSNIRENIFMWRFIWKRFRDTSKSGARLNLVLSMFSMTFGEVLKLLTLWMLSGFPLAVGAGILTGAALVSFVPGLFYYRRYPGSAFLWAFPYTYFWIIALSWINVYALMTPHRNGWLTRQVKYSNEKSTSLPLPGSPKL